MALSVNQFENGKKLKFEIPKSLLTSNMNSLNDRVNFDLKNLDRIENVIIPNTKTLIYCHGWAANSGLVSQKMSWSGHKIGLETLL